jgi:predicted RNA-binding Zn-ribbon protein involved in translation (DUF1610 family)
MKIKSLPVPRETIREHIAYECPYCGDWYHDVLHLIDRGITGGDFYCTSCGRRIYVDPEEENDETRDR